MLTNIDKFMTNELKILNWSLHFQQLYEQKKLTLTCILPENYL